MRAIFLTNHRLNCILVQVIVYFHVLLLLEISPITVKVSVLGKFGLAALKYFILKVDPKKRMVFDPKESIDLFGNTGPYIQYANARLSKVISKANCELTEVKSDIELVEVKGKS